jgi:hypothetical protein
VAGFETPENRIFVPLSGGSPPSPDKRGVDFGTGATLPVSRRKSGLGDSFADWNRLDFNVARQIDPDYLSSIFPRQFQSPIVIIAIRVFPIKRDETLRLLMGRLLERVGSVTTSTVPVVSVFTL